MKLNQGIQKYRETAKKTDPKAKKAEKAPEKIPLKAVPVKSRAGKTLAAKAVVPKPTSEKKGGAPVNKNAPPEVVAASEEMVAAEEKAREEAALAEEIAAELVADAPATDKLVKEDFSPANSTRDRLVKEYAPLIKYIAQKIAARLPANIELDDLMSSGVIGLMDAIEKYDSSRDNKFKTYAEFRIRGAILDELRAQDWVPRSVREKAKMLERCYSKIEQIKGRHATDEEICHELNVSQEEYHDLLNQVRSVSLLSYDDLMSFSKADKRSLHGAGEHGSKVPTPLSEITSATLKRLVSEAIRELPEKQRLVLSLYYYEDLNLKEIGRVLDVTESRVSQLHTQAILRLKAKLRSHWDDFAVMLG